MSATVPAPGGRSRVLQTTTSANTGAFTPADWGRFLAVSLIWGSSFLLIAESLEALRPGLVTWVRVGLGAVVLQVLPGPRSKIDREDRVRMVLLSMLWVGVPFTLFPLAQQHVSSAVTGMLNGGVPVIAALVAALLLRTPPGRNQLIGVGIGLAGVLAVSASQLDGADGAMLGVALALAATVCYGFAVNIAPPLQQRYGSVALMRAMLALATLWTAPYGLASVPDSEFVVQPVLAVVVLGAVGTGLAFLIMAGLVGSVGATRSAMTTYLIPVVAMALGVAVRGDEVVPLAGAGVVLVLIGAWFASRRDRTPMPTLEAAT